MRVVDNPLEKVSGALPKEYSQTWRNNVQNEIQRPILQTKRPVQRTREFERGARAKAATPCAGRAGAALQSGLQARHRAAAGWD
jgi:hypothetical protein